MKFSDQNRKNFNEWKSTFQKPEYYYSKTSYKPDRCFPLFNLTEDKKTVFLDSLKSNIELKIIRTEKDKRLRLTVTFPKMDPKSFSTIAESKLSLLETNIYSSGNKKVELDGVRDYENNHIDTEKKNNRIVSYKLILNKELVFVDSTLNNDNLQGNARYKLSFITGYDSLRLDRTSISKTYQFGDAELKVIDIIENKVIIQVVQSKYALSSQRVNLLNFDSIGNVFTSDFRQVRPSFLSMYTIYQSEYQIFKENPDISYEDYKKVQPLRPNKKTYVNYIVYCSYAPLKNSFMLYKPVYGGDQILEAKLSK